MSADAPGRREVAYRLFAAEYDDASLSYSESDEERAPNYVVTPTGARVNRLFAVGVLTEVESVNDDVLRGRVADPTGAFVTYAGQYQPEAMAFIDRTTPPAFVALTGKARTFEPEDSDRVFTSVRPESVNAVDADTRDRWVVSTAEATLRRVTAFDAALADDRRGDDLEQALVDAGVDETLAAGIPRAIDHYGTTTAYLEAIRQLAVDALEVVAGDRDEVRPLTVGPSEGDATELGALPADIERPDLSAVAVEASEDVESDVTDSEGVESTESAETIEATPGAGTDSGAEASTDTGTESDFDSASTETSEAAQSDETTDSSEPAAEESTAAASTETMVDTEESTDTPEPTTDTAAEPAEAVAPEGQETTAASTETESTVESESTDPTTSESESTETEPSDALGDFDDTSGDLDDSAESADTDEAEEDEGLGDFDDGMYELDEDERQEVESEFGTEFTSGAEVDEPGEADIDVPTGDEEADPAAAETTAAGSTDSVVDETAESTQDVAAEPAEAAGPETDDVAADETDEAADDEADADEPLDEADLKAAAVDAMTDLDDGDGADREKVVAAVVDEHGADPGNVEDAIQDALMSGQCYEPADGKLKAI
ncbi:hypothetical protein AUR64_12445 [Haloprofundus marisrubri]|uniref:Rpa-associated protein n=1 Tax=Haloprofundus marisrubri TaxID=1514971 RepID=A0A0W1R9R8_9EURY|nr:hypothetical protein [Haloprofundus marisrubri]KTG10372.1 hypothetical protein AUR64_12445 [Haloprofundus marisrubri]